MALYDIFIRTESGDKFKAFTWRGCRLECGAASVGACDRDCNAADIRPVEVEIEAR